MIEYESRTPDLLRGTVLLADEIEQSDDDGQTDGHEA